MSKSNKTTKVSKFISFIFTNGEEAWADNINQDNAGDCCGVLTTSGTVAGTNSFTGCLKGDKVILRANAPRSFDSDTLPSKWVMTGYA